jgi:hypothetical protein
MLYAGSSLEKGRDIFRDFVNRRPHAHLTIRLRTRVLQR